MLSEAQRDDLRSWLRKLKQDPDSDLPITVDECRDIEDLLAEIAADQEASPVDAERLLSLRRLLVRKRLRASSHDRR